MNIGKQNKVWKQTIKVFICVCYFELFVHEGIVGSGLVEFFPRGSSSDYWLGKKNFRETN